MGDLLDAIAEAAGAIYLSDLHGNAALRGDIPYVLRAIPPDAYPLKQWQDAIQYILGDYKHIPQTEQEARALLGQKTKSEITSRRQKP